MIIRPWQHALALGLILMCVTAQSRATESFEDAQDAFAAHRYGAVIATLTKLREATPAGTPDSAKIRHLLGNAHLAVGDLDVAQKELNEALEIAPTLSLVVDMATLRRTYRNKDQGEDELRQALGRYRQNDQPLGVADVIAAGQAAQLLAEEDAALYPEALQIFERAAALDSSDPRALTAIGDLLLDRYNNAEAQTAYQEALERDPAFVPALFGLARSAHFEHSPDALAKVRDVLTKSPNFVAARAFEARLHLDQEQYDDAARAIATALETNPRSPAALSLKAGLHYLRDEREEFSSTYREVRALAPGYLALYETVAEVAAQNRRYEDATRFANTGIRVDSQYWRGYALLGINQLRLGEMQAGRISLETAFRGDPYDLWTKNTLDLLDRVDGYESRRSERFLLVGPTREVQILAPLLLPIAEQAYSAYEARYRYHPPTPVRIEVHSRHEDFSVRIVGLSGVDVLGVSFGPVIVLESPATGHFGEFNWASALWHEVAHTFHLGMTGGRLPRWLAEGLAVHEEHRAREGWGSDVTPSFLNALHEGRILPISRLNEAFLRPTYPEQVGHAYFQGALFARFVEENFGFEAIAQLLTGVREGEPLPKLLEAVLGLSSSEIDQRFATRLRQRFADSTRALFGPPPSQQAQGTSAPASPYRRLVAQARDAQKAKQPGKAIEHLEAAQRLFPEHAGPDSTYRNLAALYKEQGQPLKAISQLAANLNINADDFAAHIELANLLETTSGPSTALPVLERALLIQPFDVALHEKMAGIFTHTQQWDAAARSYRAIAALSPKDPLAIGFQLARTLHLAGDKHTARQQVLSVLERAPLYRDALELLLDIRDDKGLRKTPEQ